jgi:hypothetical protein
MNYVITARCTNGHEQNLFVDGMLGLKWVEEQADILDGTSSLYLKKPAEDPESIVGKCGICKAPFICNVTASQRGLTDVNPSVAD